MTQTVLKKERKEFEEKLKEYQEPLSLKNNKTIFLPIKTIMLPPDFDGTIEDFFIETLVSTSHHNDSHKINESSQRFSQELEKTFFSKKVSSAKSKIRFHSFLIGLQPDTNIASLFLTLKTEFCLEKARLFWEQERFSNFSELASLLNNTPKWL